jgi:Family of unknown function (DUF5427)
MAQDDLDKLFEGIGDTPATIAPAASSSQDEQDLLAGLESLAAGPPKPAPSSRPHTPRVAASSGVRSHTPLGRNSGEGYSGYGLPPTRRDTGDSTTGGAKKRDSSDLRSGAGTPVAPAVRDKEWEKPSSAKEKEREREKEREKEKESAGGGGWGWGSLWNTAASTASAAVKNAEAVVKELQQSEEGKKWAEQVKQNAGALRGLGLVFHVALHWLFTDGDTAGTVAGDVKSRALPTFANLLHTLAPPISSHEQLRIHITHDLENYPFVDTVVYGVFDRVMQQVEGGDLLVVQKGGSSKPRSSLDGAFGGPWWKGMEKVVFPYHSRQPASPNNPSSVTSTPLPAFKKASNSPA